MKGLVRREEQRFLQAARKSWIPETYASTLTRLQGLRELHKDALTLSKGNVLASY